MLKKLVEFEEKDGDYWISRISSLIGSFRDIKKKEIQLDKRNKQGESYSDLIEKLKDDEKYGLRTYLLGAD